MVTPNHSALHLTTPSNDSVPSEVITVDFIVKLPPFKWRGVVYDSILVVVDAFSKFCILLPFAEKTPAEDFVLRRFVVLDEINSVASMYSYITKVPNLKKE